MKIAGYNPNSFVDYPGHISSVIFTGGCNFDCWYCHNRWLLDADTFFDAEEVLRKIKEAAGFIDAVVISGGEPTVEDGEVLLSFIKRIKELGLKVKLDTNGTHFSTLEKLLPHLDYVAMDIKAPLSKYRKVTCISDGELLSIKKSIALLVNGKIDYEFRTTFIPTLSEEDILEIAYTVKGAKALYLQQFVETNSRTKMPAHPPKFIKQVADKANKILPCFTRGI